MCTQDLKTAANEKGYEEKIEEVRRPQPQRILKRHDSSHSQAFIYDRTAIHSYPCDDFRTGASSETGKRSRLQSA